MSLRTLAAPAAFLAAATMAVPTAHAAELPAIAMPAASEAVYDDGSANQYRRYRGYGDYRSYRHRRGPGAGDIIAGVAVVGAIAAILGSTRSRDRDRYEPRYPDRDRSRERYDDRRSDVGSRGLERAADMCVDAVEAEEGRIAAIDNARRLASGWEVTGSLENGNRFTCMIGNDGRVRTIDVDSNGVAYRGAAGNGQHDADWYARARARTATPADGPYTYADRPAVTADNYGGGDVVAYPGAPSGGEDTRPQWPGDRR